MSSHLLVLEYMTRDPITVSPATEIMRAVRLLVEHNISGLPVVDSDGRLVGMLTERDCVAVAVSAGYFEEAGGSVAEHMSREVHTAAPTDNLASRFARSPFRRYPVLEGGRLVGLISRRDVLRALSSGSWFGRPPSGEGPG
jgi:CBS domain-containing protein